MNTNQRLALIAIVTAALLALLLGRYTIVPSSSEEDHAVFRLNRITGTVSMCTYIGDLPVPDGHKKVAVACE